MKMKTKASKTWGGPWTVEKLDAFEKYVKAYLTIMNSQKKKRSGWPTTIYFDGFSGSEQKDYDKRDIQKGDIQSLFFENIEQEELMTYKGSPERVLSLDMKFDEYYNVTIYHFIFGSNNKTAHDIASYIIGKKSKGRKR
jgi:three-Cys-motif partner protein